MASATAQGITTPLVVTSSDPGTTKMVTLYATMDAKEQKKDIRKTDENFSWCFTT